MTIETHTYSVSSDTPNNKVDEERLFDEIYSSESIIIALSNLSVNSDVLTINFKANIGVTAENALDEIISNHSGEPMERPAPVTHFVENIPQGGSRVTDKGFNFIALANSETVFDFPVSWDWYVKDGSLWTYGHGEDDEISMSVAIPNNGPDLHYYLENIPLDKNGEAYAKTRQLQRQI